MALLLMGFLRRTGLLAGAMNVVVFVFVTVLVRHGCSPEDIVLLAGGGCLAAVMTVTRLLLRISEA